MTCKHLESVQKPLLGDGVEALITATMVTQPYIMAAVNRKVDSESIWFDGLVTFAYNLDQVLLSHPTATLCSSKLVCGRLCGACSNGPLTSSCSMFSFPVAGDGLDETEPEGKAFKGFTACDSDPGTAAPVAKREWTDLKEKDLEDAKRGA